MFNGENIFGGWRQGVRAGGKGANKTMSPTYFGNSSAHNIERLQYQAGKIILKTKISFPKSALLSEFGWDPINEFLDRQDVNYFARVDELTAHKLCKIVFMEIKNSE